MTPKEQAIELENYYKTKCQKIWNDLKMGRIKAGTIKVNWVYPASEVEVIYNERNDNNEPWFK